MKRDKFNHGFTEADWHLAKSQARDAIIAVAKDKHRATIAYSDLVTKIRAISIDAHDVRLSHLLGEIAEEEDEAGRGMLTVFVVHKNGDHRPGKGFFEMAQRLGRNVRDEDEFWICEFNAVRDFWSNKLR